MKPPRFSYCDPTNLDEALTLKAAHGERAKLLAGGMPLIPTLKQRLARPSDLIELAGVPELKGIRRDGNAIAIGAMTRHGEVANSDLVKGAVPALAHLAELIGDPQVRNRGTLGGSLANKDPAADYHAAVLGLGAAVATNKRRIAAAECFTGMFEAARGCAVPMQAGAQRRRRVSVIAERKPLQRVEAPAGPRRGAHVFDPETPESQNERQALATEDEPAADAAVAQLAKSTAH